LLYVATTRARTRLHVCGDVVRNRAGEFGPRKGSLLAQLWPVVQERFVPPEGDGPAPRATHGPRAAQPLRRVALPLPPLAVPPSAHWDAPPEEARPRDIEFSWAGETARHIGTVTHAWLQRISEEGLDHWNREKVDSLKKVFRANLAAAGVGDAELEAAAQAVEKAIINSIEDERGRWILGPHPESHTEYRLSTQVAGVRRTFVLDRCFVDAAGTRWIVDYKTSRHEGAGREAFLDEERERYREQLAGYAKLFTGSSRQALYFPLVPGWRECA
jgi:ATP-dependent exoDNAse (exonuclease V) beta subunit